MTFNFFNQIVNINKPINTSGSAFGFKSFPLNTGVKSENTQTTITQDGKLSVVGSVNSSGVLNVNGTVTNDGVLVLA